ncbi:ABC transporter ATP-binding protein [Rhabdothermincola salaria]|uniref:ABC transporter ATP-binding protein n=1 Tax=Rhabdothermincola salaria TaxID=2903142 RepID=UPI001E534D21|nr:ABC transporter ATP-binding protein [Rhabdothermincola salaria]MCD9624507.1 ABC transporter ATP-binding protein/permease [Rhabdothermincola salaria]
MLVRLLRTHLRPYRRLLVLILLLQAGQAAANLFLPRINALIIDDGVLTGDTDYIWRMGGLMLAVSLAQIAVSITAVFVGARVAMGFGRDVRRDLFHRVTSFSQQEVDLLGAPSLINRITNDVQQVQMLVVMTMTMAIGAPIIAIGGIVMAITTDVGLSSLLIVSIPALLVVLLFIISRMVPQFRLMQTRIDGVNRVLREQITGMRVVRAFVREPEESARFADVNDKLTHTSLIAGRLMALMFPVVMLVVNASTVGVIWFGSIRVDSGDLSLGDMIAFISYFTIILMSIMMATFVALLAPRAAVSAERIVEVLDTDTSVRQAAEPVRQLDEHGLVEFRAVSFSYPGAAEPVVSEVSFRSLPGRTTAVIGSTGSGKSTLLNLVPRLYDVTGGAVLLDGVDVRDLDTQLLWDRVGLVPQKPFLFSGTVASNLRYGKPDATDDEMWAALEVAQAADFVAAMAGGLEARIAQGGGNVSGGQRQRLAIARALVRRPEVYLFDDSFSALDLATDARLRAALRPWTRDATVIVVAQRVSTIADADQILVLEEGRTVGLGTHTELLETCPTYQEIVESQAAQGVGA